MREMSGVGRKLNKWKLFFSCVILGLIALTCVQGLRANSLRVSPVIQKCILKSAYKYNVHPGLIEAIIIVESGFNPLAVNHNKNGSVDVGLMQINSFWFPTLRKYGISVRDLFDPCVNVEVGTWILAQCIARYGYTWEAVGCYNAVNPVKRKRYAWKVYRALLEKTAWGELIYGGERSKERNKKES